VPMSAANHPGLRGLRVRGAAVRDGLERGVGGLYTWLARNPVTRLPWAVVQTFSRAEGALLAGSVAYFTFLSLLPLLLLAGSVLGTVARGRIDLQMVLATAITQLLPGMEGADLLGQLIRSRVTFGLIGLVSVAYAGSGFVGAVTACLNRMWQLPAGRNPIGQKLLNLLVVVLLGVVLLGSIGISIWVRVSTERLFGEGPGSLAWIADRFAGPVMILILLVLLYRLLPARRLSWRWQIPGALFGTVVIELLKEGFELWARYSAGVSALPRSLLSVVLLLVWLGFFGQAILYGAALNVVLHRRRHHLALFPPPPGASATDGTPPPSEAEAEAEAAGVDERPPRRGSR
jgi:membrane protein